MSEHEDFLRNALGSEGIIAFAAERKRQIDVEDYTPENDDALTTEELITAGACYIGWAAQELEGQDQDEPHPFWPWRADTWKPETPKRAMEKGCALVAAGYDRALRNGEHIG